MEMVTLAAKTKEVTGSKAARNIRRAGDVPGIVYGHGMKPVALQVSARELLHVLHTKAGENVVVDLKLEGAKLKESTCVIKEIQHHPVTDAINHVDFTVISMNEKITVEVPVVAINAEESMGVKKGGVLDLVHHEIEVECLPTAIPEKIEVDVKDLDINDIVHVKELKMPEGVTSTLEDDDVVIAIHPPKVEDEAAEGAEGEGADQPEVIEKGKKTEEGAEGGEKKD